MNHLISLLNTFEKRPDLVKVFGAIIYSNRHPNIKKVLKDTDYWEALNEISGPRWAIIAARAEQGDYEIKGGGGPLGTFGMMIQVWNEPRNNKMLVEYLGLESTEEPYFVIFTRLKDGSVLRSITKLTDTFPKESYQRLRQIIAHLTSKIFLSRAAGAF